MVKQRVCNILCKVNFFLFVFALLGDNNNNIHSFCSRDERMSILLEENFRKDRIRIFVKEEEAGITEVHFRWENTGYMLQNQWNFRGGMKRELESDSSYTYVDSWKDAFSDSKIVIQSGNGAAEFVVSWFSQDDLFLEIPLSSGKPDYNQIRCTR